MIPFDDRGLLLGDGLFETLLWEGGALIDFEAHALRLERGCALVGLPFPRPDALSSAARTAIVTEGLEGARAAVRLNWSVGSGGRGLDRPGEPKPRLFALAFPAPAPAGSVSLATVSVRRNEGSPLSRVKSLSYLDNVLARREARAAGAEAGLMLNNAGEIACADAANIFWFEGERLVTPRLACGVLEGTVRGRVLARAREAGIAAEEVATGRAALDYAAGIFLTNSLTGVQRVALLDGRAVEPHPLLERLA